MLVVVAIGLDDVSLKDKLLLDARILLSNDDVKMGLKVDTVPVVVVGTCAGVET